MPRDIMDEEQQLAQEMLMRARTAQAQIEDWSQDQLNRLSQAIAWYAGNEKTFTRLAEQGAQGYLIGESFMRQDDVAGAVRDLLGNIA